MIYFLKKKLKGAVYFLAGVVMGVVLVFPWLSLQGQSPFNPALRGMVLLRVEDKGQAWYVYPEDGRRYYLGRPIDAWRIMTKLGLGISDADLKKIPLAEGQFDFPPLGRNGRVVKFMKLVPIDISDNDLDRLAQAGIKVVGGYHGLEQGADKTLVWLDRLEQRGMQAIINLANESSWTDPDTIYPEWQSDKVVDFVKKIRHHPAIWGYDISNEAGENLVNGYKYGQRITLSQLRQAASDVRQADPQRPLLLRMHYWDDEDGDFGPDNPFAAGLVDVVMLNLYSNYSLDGRKPSLPNMIADSGQKIINKIRQVDPNVKIWLAVAAFAEKPKFLLPAKADLTRDVSAALLLDIDGLGFYGWGSPLYHWYLPRDADYLLSVIDN